MSENLILAFAGRKQSGKNTASNFLHSLALPFLKATPSAVVDGETGELLIETDEGSGVFKLDRRDNEFLEYMAANVWYFIRQYSFAGPLKEFGINTLGLTEEQVYGTDEQKNSLTEYLWERMPVKTSKKGKMTAREILQYWGTEVFRKVDDDFWVKRLLENIEAGNAGISLVTDARFPNEVAAVKNAGGRVIYFTRNNQSTDIHASETALDPANYDPSNFDAIIDNENMTIHETCEKLLNILIEWKWIEAPAQEKKAQVNRNFAQVRPS